MSEPINEIAKNLTERICGQMDANLFESIISLFNQGVLVHYVQEPRTTLDTDRFHLTVAAANGVRFEGREKIISLQQKCEAYEKALEECLVLRESTPLETFRRLFKVAETTLKEWKGK